MIIINSYSFTIPVTPPPSGDYDPATQALLDQATTDGYTAPTGIYLTALDAYIIELKAQGIWALCDVIYLPSSGGDRNFAKYNLKDPTQFNLVEYNSPTYTVGEGFTGDGVSAYLDTTWNPSVDAVNYTQNAASFGLYMRDTGAQVQAQMGLTGVFDALIFRDTGSGDFNAINNNLAGNSSGGNSEAGLYFLNRSASNSFNTYLNGASIYTANRTSNGIPNIPFYILSRNNAGSAIQSSSGQFSQAFIGGDLSSLATENYNAIQTFMTAIGSEI